MQSCTEVINSSLIEHGSERFKQIWSVFEAFEFFPRHEIDLPLGHRYKKKIKSEINKL